MSKNNHVYSDTKVLEIHYRKIELNNSTCNSKSQMRIFFRNFINNIIHRKVLRQK